MNENNLQENQQIIAVPFFHEITKNAMGKSRLGPFSHFQMPNLLIYQLVLSMSRDIHLRLTNIPESHRVQYQCFDPLFNQVIMTKICQIIGKDNLPLFSWA